MVQRLALVGLAAGLGCAGLAPALAAPLRIVTYNSWHGFWRTPARELLILPSEPDGARARRARLQAEELERLAPEVVMLQETHPLPWSARGLAKALDHEVTHQLVSCGVRFLHVGVPWRIRSGLAVTASRGLGLERVAAPKLSGRLGYCGDWVGLQLEETRRALLATIEIEGGRTLLLVTTHLHSSTLGGPAREDRRLRETGALLRAIEEARRENPEILGVILGGDLNAMPGSAPIERLRSAGFVDVAQVTDSEFPTYDPWSNPLAARMTKAGGGDPARSAPRRIDYIFVSRELEAFIGSVGPFGKQPAGSEDAAFGSDHFGVVLELEF